MTIPRTEDEDENIRLILDLTERRDELKTQLASTGKRPGNGSSIGVF
ncbi:unnamed protein product, partial [Didymodactylos carnosus]